MGAVQSKLVGSGSEIVRQRQVDTHRHAQHLHRGHATLSIGAPDEALSPERVAQVFGVEAMRVDTGEGMALIARHPL